MALQRESYIRKGATKVSPKNLPVEFYIYSKGDILCAQCFVGRAQKPTWHYRFKSEAHRTRRIKEQIEAVEAKEAAKAKRKQEEKNHGWEVGLILYSSWGYDQTNIDFYEVVELIGETMCRIEKIGKERATDSDDFGHGMAQNVVANPKVRTGKTFRSKITRYGAAGEYGYKANIWDGSPKYESWYA